MHLVEEKDEAPVHTVADLVAYFSTSGKPESEWRIGTEHELIGVVPETGEGPPHDGPLRAQAT